MKISCISDIHVDKSAGEPYALLIKFMEHPKVEESDRVAFLGDIFDHLTGEHYGYIGKYPRFFDKIAELIKSGKHVHFVEGNHDFHFQKTFGKFLKSKLEPNEMGRFHYEKKGFVLPVEGTKIMFCHGDELDLGNKAYRRWKKIYSSSLFGFFISKILTFKTVESIGERASENSRRRNRPVFNYEKEKAKYRKAADEFMEKNGLDCVVSGHTHILDDYRSKSGYYINIGFPPKDKTFTRVGEDGVERIELL